MPRHTAAGAISPVSNAEKEKYARLPDFEREHYNMALEQMERYIGKPIKACISTELGGGNTAKAMYVAANHRQIHYGCRSCRAQCAGTPALHLLHLSYPYVPISVMNQFGEGAIFTHVFDDARAEELVRALAMVSQNHIAVVDHVNTAAALRDAVIRGAISPGGTGSAESTAAPRRKAGTTQRRLPKPAAADWSSEGWCSPMSGGTEGGNAALDCEPADLVSK